MKADLAQREPAAVRAWDERGTYAKLRERGARAAALRAARRTAVRQRRDPHRPRGQQDPQGRRGQVALARRLRLALHPGLGLPRPADRAAGGEEARPPRAASSTRAPFAPPAAPTRRSRSTCSAPDFKRLGILGRLGAARISPWRRSYEAQQLRAFGKIIENGHLYKGVKPVHWCLDCRSALAEAEVEYEERVSPAIDVGFRVVDNAELAARART